MNRLYRFRGWVLGLFAVALAIVPANENFISVSGYLLILLGIFLRIEARRDIGDHTRGKELLAPELVTWGIYSKIRHPLYLSNMFVGCGFALVHLGWQPLLFVFVFGFVFFIVLLAMQEDLFLKKQFGEAFLNWEARTPAFFSRAFFSKLMENSPQYPRKTFFTAIMADRWTWGWLLFYSLALIMRGMAGPFSRVISSYI